MSDLQERLTKFIKHYEEFREVYKKWTPEEIAFAACKTGQFKTLNLDFVRQQRELLIAYGKMLGLAEHEHTQGLVEEDVDDFISNL
jgi:hypothetical protein